MSGQSTEQGVLTKAHREVLAMLADRTDDRAPDPGCTTSSATFADTYNVFVHWRTARALHRRGLIEYPFKGGPEEGWSISLTPAGWAAIGRPAPSAAAKPCCAEHNDCDRPGEMVCCDDCPDIATCACGHGWHLHDGEAVPALCVICDSAERCTPSGEPR